MIQLEHVSRTFREKSMEVHALQDVSLHVREGEIYGIVGFSGAGKSTLIRLVNRLETPDTGTVRVYLLLLTLREDNNTQFTALIFVEYMCGNPAEITCYIPCLE